MNLQDQQRASENRAMLPSLRFNPTVFRIRFPRIAQDGDFEELRAELARIGAERVYFFDNGYMGNYQLADDALEERVRVLSRRIAQLKQDGIVAGINSGATISHGGLHWFTELWEGTPDLAWWTGSNGTVERSVACPLDLRFHAFCDRYFTRLTATGERYC